MKTQAITLIIAILGVLHGPLIAALIKRTKARRNRQPPAADYPGIRLRISTPSGTVIEADSNDLYHHAGRQSMDWCDLIAGGDAGTTEFSTVPLKIEIKPVRLGEARE